MKVEPVTLELAHGRARLEPLTLDHAPALFEAASDEAIWRYLPFARPTSGEGMEAYIRFAFEARAVAGDVPFAIIDRAAPGAGRVIGSTRYMAIQPDDRALEIGWTLVGVPWQRTSINTECKYLLLRHAFEQLGAIRVQLKTDGRNVQSQNAIARLGAVREGTLRKCRIMPDGFIRDTVYFSILDNEWPAVKRRLESFLHLSPGAADAGASSGTGA